MKKLTGVQLADLMGNRMSPVGHMVLILANVGIHMEWIMCHVYLILKPWHSMHHWLCNLA
jgi:hypothetical protein